MPAGIGYPRRKATHATKAAAGRRNKAFARNIEQGLNRFVRNRPSASTTPRARRPATRPSPARNTLSKSRRRIERGSSN